MGAHVINPDQLQLFMTGTELKSAITNSIDRAPMGRMSDMWKRKLRESKRSDMSHGAGTYQSLAKHGWQGEGVDVMHVRKYGALPEWDRTEVSVSDAHHRIAAAADIEAKGKRQIFIPTNHDEYPSLVPEHRQPK